MLDNQEDMKSLVRDKLLCPSRLQGALTEVSFDPCMELTREEYPWIANLMQRMRGKTMLMREEEFLLYLSPQFWNEEERKTLPGKTSGEILDALCSLGIVMKRTTALTSGNLSPPIRTKSAKEALKDQRKR